MRFALKQKVSLKGEKQMEFYSVVLRKKIDIPTSKIVEVVKKGRKFAVGTYTANGKTYKAWRVLGMSGAKKKK